MSQMIGNVKLSPKERRLVAAFVIVGGTSGMSFLRRALAGALLEQQQICSEIGVPDNKNNRRQVLTPKVAVDAVFAKRIGKILKICVPTPWCAEARLIYLQSALLVVRTLLTDLSTRIEGGVGRYIIAKDTVHLRELLVKFLLFAIPGSYVNAALKYLQTRIKLAFMHRLTHHLHHSYFSHRAYYAASWLGGLTSAESRLSADVEKFSFAISELYSYTFKPALDVALFTRSLAAIMGWKSQFILYGYYMCCTFLLRATSPPLAQLTAQEAKLAGAFRGAHARVSAFAEEIAFNDPPASTAEKMILNQHLHRMLRHSRLSAFQRFVQGIIDQYLVKYGATVVALAVYANHSSSKAASSSQSTAADYIRAMRLLNNTSRGIGDLILVYKRVTSLAGHTARVSELLEQVGALGGEGSERVHVGLFLRNVSSSGSFIPPSAPDGSLLPPPEPNRAEGAVVAFNRVYLSSPDGTPLVRELSFEVPTGRSVLVMGPNGSGKSSLFRVAAGLWPLQAGEVTLPPKGELFYLSQRPYLVAGTLRDQLLYPEPPRSVYECASSSTKRRIAPWMKSTRMDPEELEEKLCYCLEAVELDYLLGRGKGWDQVQSWDETLSGGEKQRLAMARLLFHTPRYAILDEATSAVSADGEKVLYIACVKAGITMLSIGHRPALRNFHSQVVHLEGQSAGKGWHHETLREKDLDGLEQYNE
jgi:ABC-type uncharacterized transport system fused permease/ATPase subunit